MKKYLEVTVTKQNGEKFTIKTEASKEGVIGQLAKENYSLQVKAVEEERNLTIAAARDAFDNYLRVLPNNGMYFIGMRKAHLSIFLETGLITNEDYEEAISIAKSGKLKQEQIDILAQKIEREESKLQLS